jgi:cytochrome d ubiquinol oxidase subunit II
MNDLLPLLSAAAAALAITFYVVLDGFDLGVGVLLLSTRDERFRDCMVVAIAPTWDGNETWLIMAGVTLLAAFPVAYGVLLPAFYLPLLVMLMALGCRGVSFEFRVQPGARIHLWDRAFAWGSVVAALCQGVVVGAMLEGVHVEDGRFAGSLLDLLRPYPIFMGVVLLVGYVTLGAAWIVLRTTGRLHDHVQRLLRGLLPLFAILGVAAIGFAPVVQEGVGARWKAAPVLLALLGAGFVTMLGLAWRMLARKRERAPFVCVASAFLFGLIGLVAVVYPDIVPFRVSLQDAASPRGSQLFLLIGIAIVMPVVLAYSAFAYYVFRGKVVARET